MDSNDFVPPKKKNNIKNLDVMSIEALSEYISDLEREIKRVHKAIGEKKAARSTAESIFDS